MKTRSLLLLGLLMTAIICLPQLTSFGSAADTNAESSATALAAAAPTLVDISELQNLRDKLDSIQHASDMASGRFHAMIEQNAALSNVLASLQETLVSQQETLISQQKREAQISEDARALNLRVMMGAAAAMFLVFLASYWFQLRCLNRVMEMSRSNMGLQGPYGTALLEAPVAPAADSKLLEAVKHLENRIQMLEAPASVRLAAPGVSNGNGNGNGNGHSENGDNGHAEEAMENGASEPSTASAKIGLLLAKGEIQLDVERFQDALNSFQDAVALDPANAEAHLKKGIALERLNKLELALGAYEEALRLNPKRAFAHVHKARVLAALHRYDEALSVYDDALGKNAQKGAASGFASHLHRVNATGSQ